VPRVSPREGRRPEHICSVKSVAHGVFATRALWRCGRNAGGRPTSTRQIGERGPRKGVVGGGRLVSDGVPMSLYRGFVSWPATVVKIVRGSSLVPVGIGVESGGKLCRVVL